MPFRRADDAAVRAEAATSGILQRISENEEASYDERSERCWRTFPVDRRPILASANEMFWPWRIIRIGANDAVWRETLLYDGRDGPTALRMAAVTATGLVSPKRDDAVQVTITTGLAAVQLELDVSAIEGVVLIGILTRSRIDPSSIKSTLQGTDLNRLRGDGRFDYASGQFLSLANRERYALGLEPTEEGETFYPAPFDMISWDWDNPAKNGMIVRIAPRFPSYLGEDYSSYDYFSNVYNIGLVEVYACYGHMAQRKPRADLKRALRCGNEPRGATVQRLASRIREQHVDITRTQTSGPVSWGASGELSVTGGTSVEYPLGCWVAFTVVYAEGAVYRITIGGVNVDFLGVTDQQTTVLNMLSALRTNATIYDNWNEALSSLGVFLYGETPFAETVPVSVSMVSGAGTISMRDYRRQCVHSWRTGAWDTDQTEVTIPTTTTTSRTKTTIYGAWMVSGPNGTNAEIEVDFEVRATSWDGSAWVDDEALSITRHRTTVLRDNSGDDGAADLRHLLRQQLQVIGDPTDSTSEIYGTPRNHTLQGAIPKEFASLQYISTYEISFEDDVANGQDRMYRIITRAPFADEDGRVYTSRSPAFIHHLAVAAYTQRSID